MSDGNYIKKSGRQRKLYTQPADQQPARKDPRRPRSPAAALPADLANWLKQRALYLLARREYSQHELRLKLLSALQRRTQTALPDDEVAAGFSADENGVVSKNDYFDALITTLLLELEQAGWQSDQRFLASMMRRKAERTGVRLLIPALKEHDLPADLMEAARDQLNATEFERALALWRRRFGDQTSSVLRTEAATSENAATRADIAAHQYKQKTRQLRFLVSRGFSSAIALAVLREGAQSDLHESRQSTDRFLKTQNAELLEMDFNESSENASDDPYSG